MSYSWNNSRNVASDLDELCDVYDPQSTSNTDDIQVLPLEKTPSPLPRNDEHDESSLCEFGDTPLKPNLDLIIDSLNKIDTAHSNEAIENAYGSKGTLLGYSPKHVVDTLGFSFKSVGPSGDSSDKKRSPLNPESPEFIPYTRDNEAGCSNTKSMVDLQIPLQSPSHVLSTTVTDTNLPIPSEEDKQKKSARRSGRRKKQNVAISSILADLSKKMSNVNINDNTDSSLPVGTVNVACQNEPVASSSKCLDFNNTTSPSTERDERTKPSFIREVPIAFSPDSNVAAKVFPEKKLENVDPMSKKLAQVNDLNLPIAVEDIQSKQKVLSWLHSESMYNYNPEPTTQTVPLDEMLTYTDRELAFKAKSSLPSASPIRNTNLLKKDSPKSPSTANPPARTAAEIYKQYRERMANVKPVQPRTLSNAPPPEERPGTVCWENTIWDQVQLKLDEKEKKKKKKNNK